MYSPRLRTTLRCLTEDLGLDSGFHGRDVRDYCAEHEALRKMQSQRALDPASGEVMVGYAAGCRSLHVGRPRALTLWDPGQDVCWLLAYDRNHTTGDRKDAYQTFEHMFSRGLLLPTEDDYLSLEDDLSVELIEAVTQLGQGLMDEARSRPGHEACDSLYREDGLASIVIDVVVIEDEQSKLEEGFVGVTLPQGSPWPGVDIYILATALVGGQELLTSETVGRRRRRSGELAFRWNQETEIS